MTPKRLVDSSCRAKKKLLMDPECWQKLQQSKKSALQLCRLSRDPQWYRIDSNWLRGFIEAEGCFTESRPGGPPLFQITQLACDGPLLQAIVRTIGAGRLHTCSRKGRAPEMVLSLLGVDPIEKHLLPRLVPGFVFSRVQRRYKDWLARHFPHKKIFLTPAELNPICKEWLIGFIEGDGSFYFVLRHQKDYRYKWQIQAVFDLSQSVPPEELSSLGAIIFGPGISPQVAHHPSGNNHLRLVNQKIVRYWTAAHLPAQQFQSRKLIDYMFWQLGCDIIAAGQHLRADSYSFFLRLVRLQRWWRGGAPSTRR